MNRQWKTKRHLVQRPDAQRRWDQAYQCLMNWTLCPTPSTLTEHAQAPQEESDEKSRVRARIHPATGTPAND